MDQAFAFLLNLYEFTGNLPTPILPDFELAHASPDQMRIIEEFLRENKTTFVCGTHIYYSEPLKARPIGSCHLTPLPSDKVKFWVINFPWKQVHVLHNLDRALLLSGVAAEFGALFNSSVRPNGRNLFPTTIFHFSQEHSLPIERSVSADQFSGAAKVLARIQEFEGLPESEAHAPVLQAIAEFHSLKSGPRQGGSLILALFALIESLVTHDPHKFGDSLNHQLSTKMPLLARRFSGALDPTQFFKLGDVQKVWKRLYEVRSLIAHGGRVIFSKGLLRDLCGFIEVRDFLDEALRLLLLFALEEPHLVHDLKAC